MNDALDLVPAPAVVRMARLNLTFSGSNGDLPDMVSFDATDADIKRWAAEAVQQGYVPGIPATEGANFADYVIDRFPATAELPDRLFCRPKTAFGA